VAAAAAAAAAAPPPPPVDAEAPAPGDADEETDAGAEAEAGGAAGASAGGGGGGGGGGAQSRRARRDAAKASRAAAADAAAAAAGASAAAASAGARAAEEAALGRLLAPLGLALHAVPADGSCLFAAVADQLAVGAGRRTLRADDVRRRAADVLRSRWPEFAPFLPFEPRDGYAAEGAPAAVRAAVESYARRLEATAAWGGHPELRALASTLGAPILVYQAHGEPWRFEPDGAEVAVSAPAGRAGAGAEGGGGGVIRLAFQRDFSAGGEHYSSVRPRELAGAVFA